MTLERIVRDNVHGSKVRRMLEMAFEQTRMAMCFTDPHQDDNPIVAINAAFTRLTGYEEEEIVGRNCRFLQVPESDPAEIQRIRDCIERREVGYFELLNQRKDGTPFWNALHVGPVFSEDGELLYFFGSQWDVSDRVEAVRALEGKARLRDRHLQGAIDEASRLREAIDQANDSMILTEYGPLDEPGPRILWASKGHERMTGYPLDEVVGRTPRMFQGPRTDRATLARIRAALEAGEGVRDVRAINYRRDGTPYHLEWSIAPVAGEGSPRYWLAIQRDVTGQVEAQEKLELLSRELNHRHMNLFTLVTALQNLVPVEGLSAEEYRAALASRMDALRRGHELVFSGRAEGAPIASLVDRVLAPFPGDRIVRRGEALTIEARPALNLSLLLHELATNAVKYGALSVPGGWVELDWRDEGDDLRLRWTERGGPPVRPPEREGFGRKLIGILTGGGTGEGRMDFAPDGVRFEGVLALD